MRRVVAVIVIGVLMTLALGVDQVSWASQGSTTAERDAQRERVTRRLAELRPGSTVEIERTDRSKMRAVIEDIGPDSIRVLAEEVDPGKTARTSKGVVSQTIPIDDIRDIRAVNIRRSSADRKLIIAAVAAGLVALTACTLAVINAAGT